MRLSLPIVGALAYQIIIVAFMSYLAWFALVTRYPASKLSTFSFLTPLFGIGLAHIILGEIVTLTLGVGCVLVVTGIYLVNKQKFDLS